MKVISSNIPGVILLEPEFFFDGSGYFLKVLTRIPLKKQ